jgi:hypothetical protein
MKRLLRIFALLMAASMLIWIAGCGDDDDDDDDDVDPEVLSTTPAEGGTQAANASVTFNMNRSVPDAAVAGVAGTTAVQGNSVVFTPTDKAAGSRSLTLTSGDFSFTLNYTATQVDETPPALVGASCDPKDGADGVDPADYPEKLEVAFSEALADATVTSTDPEFKFTPTVDGEKLVISFLQYSMPNETEFEIAITAVDPAGNSVDVVYGFTTMAKEQ